MNQDRIKEIPKIDLHCHLDGSLRKECLQELLGRKVDIAELQVEDHCQSLAQYLEKFDLPLSCLQTEAGLKRAGYDFIQNVAQENVKYVEVRFAPALSQRKGLDCETIMGAVLEGLEAGKKEYDVEYNVIACAMRHLSYEENLRMAEEVRGFYGKGLCAFDLAGNEAAFPIEEFSQFLGNIVDMGIPFTIHGGECGRVENVTKAVEYGAKRIGHGIALRGHKDAIEICRDKKIGIEMCPISNLQTKAVRKVEDYPIREFIQKGLLITLNTDNRTVSNTSIEKEIKFVQKNWAVTDEEVLVMMQRAVEVSFAQEQVKQKLRKLFEG